jgi:hypothetical protein
LDVADTLDVSKSSPVQIDLVKLVQDLFGKLQKRIDVLRAGYVELNELQELSQSYELLIERLARVSDRKGDSVNAGVVAGVLREAGGDEESMSVVLDDVMQCFDFLDEADANCEDENRICDRLVKTVNVENLPSDFNHFLIRHISRCVQLLDVSCGKMFLLITLLIGVCCDLTK